MGVGFIATVQIDVADQVSPIVMKAGEVAELETRVRHVAHPQFNLIVGPDQSGHIIIGGQCRHRCRANGCHGSCQNRACETFFNC